MAQGTPISALARFAIFVMAVAAVVLSPPPAGASSAVSAAPHRASELPEGSFIAVRVRGGDRFSGELLAIEQGTIRLRHDLLGELSLPLRQVVAIEYLAPPGVDRPVPPVDEPPEDPVDPEEPDPDPELPERPRADWSGQIAAGFSGSEGNTETLRLRLEADARRRTQDEILTMRLNYILGTDRGRRSENRLFARARNRWLVPDSKWEYFAEGSAEFNEFRDFDARFTAGGGLGYRFIESDRTTLEGRAGAGFSYELGSNDPFTPEAILGLDLAHQIAARHSVNVELEAFPSLEDFGEIRAAARARWDIALNESETLMLGLGFENRYDSQPEGQRRNDFDYFARIIYRF